MVKGVSEEKVIVDHPNPSVTVLWLSRHPPLRDQVELLHAYYGPVRIVQYSGVVKGGSEVVEIAERHGAKVVVAVLPLHLLAQALQAAARKGITILIARMRPINVSSEEEARRLVEEAPGRRNMSKFADGTVRVYEFEGYEKVKRITVETEPLASIADMERARGGVEAS